MQPTELVTLNMRELDRLKVIQAVVDRMLKPGLAAEHALILLLGITCGMRVTGLVNGAIQILPAALDLDVSLIDTPAPANRAFVMPERLLQHRKHV